MIYTYTVYRDDHVAPVFTHETDSSSGEQTHQLADRFGLGDHLMTSISGTSYYADGKVTVSPKEKD